MREGVLSLLLHGCRSREADDGHVLYFEPTVGLDFTAERVRQLLEWMDSGPPGSFRPFEGMHIFDPHGARAGEKADEGREEAGEEGKAAEFARSLAERARDAASVYEGEGLWLGGSASELEAAYWDLTNPRVFVGGGMYGASFQARTEQAGGWRVVHAPGVRRQDILVAGYILARDAERSAYLRQLANEVPKRALRMLQSGIRVERPSGPQRLTLTPGREEAALLLSHPDRSIRAEAIRLLAPAQAP